tara:strand:- start:1631 stop:1864 length:234 start_codon:yes stop_codon:yes gene_type:complete
MISKNGWGFALIGGPATGGTETVLEKHSARTLENKHKLERWMRDGCKVSTGGGCAHFKPGLRCATQDEIETVKNLVG